MPKVKDNPAPEAPAAAGWPTFPKRGGSFVRDPATGALTEAPAPQPKEADHGDA